MATVLSVGDIAIVQYNSSTTDSFTFVFLRDVEAGTSRQFHRQRLAGRRRIPGGRRNGHLHGGRRGYRRYDRHADRA